MNPLKVRQTMECPVCFFVRRGEVFVCKNGHSVCGSCFTKLPAQLCPLARCGFDNPPRHNLTVEQLIADCGVTIDCDNGDHGCLFKGVGQALEEHLLGCLNREVPCPLTNCQTRVRLSELARHLDTSPDHGVEQGLQGVAIPIEDCNADWVPTLKQIDGKTFYLQMVVRDGTWFTWVMVAGGARDAAKWSCEVTAGEGDMAATQVWSAKNLQVHPIDRTVEQILESGQYLSFTKQQARITATWVLSDLGIRVGFDIKKKRG